MQFVRLTARPPIEKVPRTLRLLVASEHVAATRWVSWNLADSRGVTVLFHVVGDADGVEAGLSGAPEVVDAAVAPAVDGAFYLLATLDPSVSPLMTSIFDTIRRDGVVFLPPVAERDGALEIGLVGGSAAVSDVVDGLPPGVDLEVRAVGRRGLAHEPPAAPLSPRQREAVLAALELGYYDQPRQATHEDVAEVLSCAPSTASEHLQKAEAKLVRAALPRRD
jgi:hypothetical protein